MPLPTSGPPPVPSLKEEGAADLITSIVTATKVGVNSFSDIRSYASAPLGHPWTEEVTCRA